MKDLSNAACIVGVDESDEIGILPGKSQLSLHLEAIANAVRDAGLKVRRHRRDLHGRVSTRRPCWARRSGSPPATSTAPASAVARSSSWWSTRWRRFTTASVTWP